MDSRSSNLSTTPVSTDPTFNADWIVQTLGRADDLVVRPIPLEGEDRAQEIVLFLRGLADEQTIRQHIIEPLINCSQARRASHPPVNVLSGQNVVAHKSLDAALSALLAGDTVVFSIGERNCHVISTPGWTLRPIKEPPSQKVVRGPREAFTETLEQNIAMIRRWLRDPKLRVQKMQIGTRTKTDVAVLFLEDVARPQIVTEVRRRLARIDIDGVVDSGYVEQLIKDNRITLFPLTQSSERSDKVTAGILEGRVAILVDKSPSAIIVPVTVNELYQSSEDYYFDYTLGTFLRLVRLLGNNLAIALPGLYIALVAVNPELLPTKLTMNIAASRMGVPFPIIIEVLLIEVTIEIFREASLRLPSAVAQTLGVTAGVVLGFAAVQVGLVANSTLVVSVVTAIASFSGPDYSVGVAWRLLKFFMIFGAALFGLYGLTMAGLAIVAHMATLKSFGVPYLAPWAPLQPAELPFGPVRAPLWMRLLRPVTYLPENPRRGSDDPKGGL